MAERFWEIDFLRGMAIVSMVSFHFMWNIDYLGLGDIELYSGALFFFAHAIGTVFLLLVGMSLSLSHSRVKGKMAASEIHHKYLARGLKIFALGLLISFITWLIIGDRFVAFGVLHCIGLSIILAIPLLRYRTFNIALGSSLIAIGILLGGVTIETPWFLWLGLESAGLASVDYFPLLPWFGVVLLGLGLGNILYPDYTRRVKLPDLEGLSILKPICTMGRHSLLIYLVHQPILIALMTLIILTTV
jgi:uncharacterized membrane protein